MTRLRRIAALSGSFGLAALVGWGIVGWALPGGEKSGVSLGRKTLPPATRVASTGLPGGPDEWIAAVARAGSVSAQCQAAVDLAAALDPADFQRMLDRLDLLPGHAAQDLFVRSVVRRWIATDPKAAVDWCSKHKADAVGDAVADWARLDPKAAEAYVDGSDQTGHATATAGFLRELAKTDPAACYAAIAAHPAWNGLARSQAFDELAKADPQRLLDAAEGYPAGDRTQARGSAVGAMAARDLAGTMAWLAQQPDGPGLTSSALRNAPDVSSAIEAWTKLAALPRIPSRSLFGQMMAQKDSVGTLQAVASMGQTDDDGVREELALSSLRELAYHDPERAAELLPTLNLQATRHAEQLAALSWAENDPVAALQWAQSLPAGRIDEPTLTRLTALASEPEWDPSPVGRYLTRVKEGYLNPADVCALATPEERVLALDGLSQPGALPAGFDLPSTLEPFVQNFPNEYADWILRQPTATDRGKKIATAMQAWGASDPTAAAAWIVEKLPLDQQPGAVGALVRGWNENDPEGARAWFRSLPPAVTQSVAPPGPGWRP